MSRQPPERVWRAVRVGFAEVAAVEEALGVPEPVAWTLVQRQSQDWENVEARMVRDD